MSSSQNDYDVAIVGAGAVGLLTALWAQASGLNVLLIDKDDPGMGASFGNAGTIATYACMPVNSPSVFSQFPYLLFSKTSPLKIDALYAIANFPWFMKFLLNCTPGRVRQISKHLSNLLNRANDGLNPLLQDIDTDDLIVSKGCLYVYKTEQEFNAAANDIKLREHNNVRFEIISESDVKNLEPAIKMPVYKALYFTDARHVTNPGELMKRLYSLFLKRGGSWLKGHVRNCKSIHDRVEIYFADQTIIFCKKLVISAGAYSKTIAGSGAEFLPLDTERGYHLMFEGASHILSRPVGWAAAGFYATPMINGLRIAGTVELAGLSKPENGDRYDYLQSMAEIMLGRLGKPSSYWLGFRPTMSDALPVIGYAPNSSRILFAFGHQHVGLTLSGITGKLVTGLLANAELDLDMTPYSPQRFI